MEELFRRTCLELNEMNSATLKSLNSIWDRLGFEDNDRRDRVQMIRHHMENLTEKMVEEEDGVLKQITEDIKNNLGQIDALNLELENAPYEYYGPEGLVKKENIISQELKRLNNEKEKRMVELFSLKSKESELCHKLVQTPGK